VLDEAINKGRQIAFTYNEFGTDKKLHPRKNAEGKVREYIVNPYQLVVANGRYYLICNYDKYDNVSNYIYMFSGNSVRVKFRAESKLAGEIIDWFGQDETFTNDTGLKVDVHVKVNEKAFVFWALQYGKYIEVLEPKSIKEQVKNADIEILKKYDG